MVPSAAKKGELKELKSAPQIKSQDATDEAQPSTSQRTRGLGPTVKSAPLSSGWKRVLRPLANIKLAIAELTAIAVLSSVGTVIEQNKSPMFYVQNFPDEGTKVLGFLTYDMIFNFELDHIYSASYFLVLLGMLGVSLIACTLTNQLPQVKVAQRWRFRTTESSYANLDVAKEVPDARLDDLARALAARNYQIFVKREEADVSNASANVHASESNATLYAFKGLGGKLAPIGVHGSMIFTMLGIVWGILGGFQGTAMIQEGDAEPFSELLQPATMVAIPPKGSSALLKVDNFRISYRPDGSIQQFYSDVAVEDRFGNELKRETISVNKPLRYGGITAYQTDWSMTAMRVTYRDNEVLLPMAALEGLPGSAGKLYGAFLPLEAPVEGSDAKPKGISLLAKDLESVVVYDSKGAFAGVRRPASKKPITVDGVDLVINDIVASSGMELKADPGIPLVYAGFGGICITTVLSYLSHSQTWAMQRKDGSLVVGGRTNRALVGYEVEMNEMIDSLPEIK